jgi:CcmD family protein
VNVGWLVAALGAATLIVAIYAFSLVARRRRLERRMGELDGSLR